MPRNGITGLTAMGRVQGFTDTDPELTPAELHGGSVNPAHGNPGEVASPYPWQAYGGALGQPQGPLGVENELLGEPPEQETLVAGFLAQDPTGDQTPYHTHAGPFPRGRSTTISPEDTAANLRQNSALRGMNLGADRARQRRPTMLAKNDNWLEYEDLKLGSDGLQDIPGQLKGSTGGFGTRDRVQSFAPQNEYGFDRAHQHRRYAQSPIPGNYMYLNPAGRPMRRNLPGPARPANGPGPFYGDDLGTTFAYDNGAILQDPATEYAAPPQPYVAPAYASQSDVPDLEWY